MNAIARARAQLRLRLDLADSLKSWRLARSYRLDGAFRRVYLYHVRKTGGTSLTYMFLGLGGEDSRQVYARLTHSRNYRVISGGKVFVGWRKELIEQGRYYYAFSHIPAHELRLPPETFTVTCLRDPVERVISLYKMLLEYRAIGKPHPAMKKQGRWLGDSFGDFLERIPREHLLRQLFMFSKTFSPDEAFGRIRACSHYFFLEDFADGAQSLSARLGLAFQPVHVHQSQGEPDIEPHEAEELRARLEPERVLCDRLRGAQGAA